MIDDRRKRKFSNKRGAGKRKPSGPRKPPPDHTGEEDTYIQDLIERGEEIAIHMLNGDTVRGTLARHERDLLWLTDPEGREVILSKKEIRLLAD